jgi:FkbM family methyltransferase
VFKFVLEIVTFQVYAINGFKKKECVMKYVCFIAMLVMMFFLNTLCLAGIEIVQDNGAYDVVGYNNEFPQNNGEYRCMSYFFNSGDIVFDVGANAGEWTAEVLRHNNNVTVYAFEPMPMLVAHMRQRYEKSAVHVFQLAVGETLGTRDFYFFPTVTHLSSLYERPIVANLPHEKCTVQAVSLDEFCLQHDVTHINFLKIDTEGGELGVLLGAKKLLQNHSVDAVQFEYGGTYRDAKITLQQVYTVLTAFGYKIYRIAPQFLIHIPVWRDALENYQYCNYLALK